MKVLCLFFLLLSFSGVGCSIVDNLSSVNRFKEIVRRKFEKEVLAGRVAGPFTSPPFDYFRISPLGIIPKKDSLNFWMIHHLSFPAGSSLNDDIDLGFFPFSYSSFDDAISLVLSVGCSAFLAKADNK